MTDPVYPAPRHNLSIVNKLMQLADASLRPQSSRIVGLSRDGKAVILENGIGSLILMPREFASEAELETLGIFEDLRDADCEMQGE